MVKYWDVVRGIEDVPIEQVLGLVHFDYNVERDEYSMTRHDSEIILQELNILKQKLRS